MLKKNVIAIIPARNNSKRIPGKNYKKFNGKPIIVNTIKISELNKNFSEVMFFINNLLLIVSYLTKTI